MSNTVCAEQHKFHSSHQLMPTKKTLLLRDVDIPPRKLIGRRSTNPPGTIDNSDMFADSQKISAADETLLRKFFPYNTGNSNNSDDSDSDDPYSSDHFRMFEFKVRKCTRSRSHDWTDCPFAHPGEKARRRDPRRYHYSGLVCPEYRRGGCCRGDNCEFAHGVFECWLHPARYRTEACKDGKHCKRKVCFFAHSPRQLRVLPPQNSSPVASPTMVADKKYQNLVSNNHCCIYCQSLASSPTSTLMGMSSIPHLSSTSPSISPSLSPPISPMKCQSFNSRILSYKDALTELMSSLEAINIDEASRTNSISPRNLSWVDISFNAEDQPQFILSPSTPIKAAASGSRKFFSGDSSSKRTNAIDDNNKLNMDNNGCSCPDLGWVNELLM